MLINIGQYPVRPGLLVEWSLHPVVAGEPAEDPRAPSYLQETHISYAAFSRMTGRWSPSWLAVAFDLPGNTGLDTLESVFLTWIERHETLRTGFRFAADQLRRFTFAHEEVELRPKVVGEFSDGEDINRYLEGRFDGATDPLGTWAPSLFAAVMRDDSTTVFVAFDHSNTDGYSIGLVPHEIHQINAATIEGRPHGLPEVGSHADYSEAERAAGAKIGSDHPAVAVWKEFLDAGGRTLPAFPLDLGVMPEQLPESTGRLEPLVTAADADAFEAACRAADSGFLAGLLAAAAIAALEIGGLPEFRTTVPMHTRSDSRWASSVGWYVNSLPVSFRLTGADGFADVAASAAQAVRKALPALTIPSVRAWELTGTVPLLRYMISFMDCRALPGNEHWKDWNMSALGKAPRGDHVFLWFHRTHDEVSVTAIHPDTEIARQNIRRYLDRIRRIIKAVASTGTYLTAPRPAEDQCG